MHKKQKFCIYKMCNKSRFACCCLSVIFSSGQLSAKD